MMETKTSLYISAIPYRNVESFHKLDYFYLQKKGLRTPYRNDVLGRLLYRWQN